MDDKILDQILGGEEEKFDLQKEDERIYPLIPEIDLIDDMGIHSFTRTVLLNAPSFFWEIPVASPENMKNHPPDESRYGGNILHTKRVVRMVDLLANAQQRPQLAKDMLISAALIHDVTKAKSKNGKDIEYDSMHAYTVDSFVRKIREKDKKSSSDMNSSSIWIEEDTLNEILRLVRCHMGAWSKIPETVPSSSMEWTLHFADMLASKLHLIIDEVVQMWRWEHPNGG